MLFGLNFSANDTAKIGPKAKLTTIYTTTDRNGQVFIKRIHENYREIEDDCDDDDDEDESDEESAEDSAEDDENEEAEQGYEYDCEDRDCGVYDQETSSGMRNRKNYYDDAYFVDDDEDEDDEDEDDEDDDDMEDVSFCLKMDHFFCPLPLHV